MSLWSQSGSCSLGGPRNVCLPLSKEREQNIPPNLKLLQQWALFHCLDAGDFRATYFRSSTVSGSFLFSFLQSSWLHGSFMVTKRLLPLTLHAYTTAWESRKKGSLLSSWLTLLVTVDWQVYGHMWHSELTNMDSALVTFQNHRISESPSPVSIWCLHPFYWIQGTLLYTSFLSHYSISLGTVII